MRRYFLHDKIKSERRPDDRQAFAFLLVSLDRFQYTIDKESCAARNQHGWFPAARGKVWIRGLRKELRPMNKQEKLKKISIGVRILKRLLKKTDILSIKL